MSEARTDTTETRPQTAAAQAAAGPGRHRGPAASEDGQSTAHGRHRRPATEQES